MVNNMRENLKMINRMEKEYTLGLVVRNMREISKMIKVMEME